MGLKGYTFDRMKISPKADALLYHSMLDGNDRIVKGYKDELKVVATGLNTYISPGACVVQGRLIEIDEETQLSVSANDSGYVCIVIDLTQNNTSTGVVGTSDYAPVNNQIRLEVVKELVQQDLHDGGQLYTFPLASFTSTGTTVALTKINHNQRIVESGSNANGGWTKFADGTMIANVFIASLELDIIAPNATFDVQIPNPVQFEGTPTPQVNTTFVDANGNPLYVPYVQLYGTGATENYWSVRVKNNSTSSITRTVAYSCIAIGRWK